MSELNHTTFIGVEFNNCKVCHARELLNDSSVCSSCQFCRSNPQDDNPWFFQPDDDPDDLDDGDGGGPAALALV